MNGWVEAIIIVLLTAGAIGVHEWAHWQQQRTINDWKRHRDDDGDTAGTQADA